jgi:SAM-dependent methyltransferase
MEDKEWDYVAEDYHKYIISPFYGNVENPIFSEIKKIKNKKKKVVADFGCGYFRLAEYLSKKFKKVHGSDFSSVMVKKAKELNKDLKNVNIVKEDLRKISYKNKFDVIIIVNSILMPSLKDRKKCLNNLYNALKDDGHIIMILPSFESVLYHGMLLYDYNLSDNKNEYLALKKAKEIFEFKKYDFFLGHYNDEGSVQKFYYKHELRYFLKKSGFSIINIKKVLYDWGEDISDYEDFPEEDRLWDWFVRARKIIPDK